jgi:hypothetical protein
LPGELSKFAGPFAKKALKCMKADYWSPLVNVPQGEMKAAEDAIDDFVERYR